MVKSFPRWAAGAVVGTCSLLAVSGSVLAATPSQTCQSSKNKEAGKYANCRQKAEATFALAGDAALRTVKLQKCTEKFTLKWPLYEAKASAKGDPCASVGDQTAIQSAIEAHADAVATALGGGAPPDCPGDLAACLAAPKAQPLKTGQTTCWDAGGAVIPCAGTGQDGELQKGLARAYVDNGDGTITDAQTGLMWEKQSDDGTLNDRDNTYTWGHAFAVKIAGLNAGGGFAGYTDWRLPNRAELESFLELRAAGPLVSPVFNTNCTAGCSLATCSCTRSNVLHWSSSTYRNDPTFAWAVSFLIGDVTLLGKGGLFAVRGVRGGS